MKKSENLRTPLSILTEQVRDFRKQLENSEADEDKKFKRRKSYECFYTVTCYCGKFVACQQIEIYDKNCNDLYDNNNYFLTEKRTQEVADKLNHLMRQERLHDELCPEYKADFENTDLKYYVVYDHEQKSFSRGVNTKIEVKSRTYFPNVETVEKACDILNAELEQTK